MNRETPALTLRHATGADWPYLNKVMDGRRHEFGFWPKVWIADALQSERIQIGELNAQPATLFIHGTPDFNCRVFAAYTNEDARLSDFCRLNFLSLLTDALPSYCERVILRSAEALPCNLVWPRLGLSLVTRTGAKTATARPLNHWRLQLPKGEELEAYLDEQTRDPKRKRLLQLFGMEETFRAAMTTRYRKRGAK